jgi:hypothetical protein
MPKVAYLLTAQKLLGYVRRYWSSRSLKKWTKYPATNLQTIKLLSCVSHKTCHWMLDCRTGSLHLGPCIRALCAPHWNSFLPSSPEALRTYRRERRKLKQLVIHRRSWDFLHAPKLGHGTNYFTSPPKEGMLRIFSHRKKSNGFGRVRTRELGNQRPAC